MKKLFRMFFLPVAVVAVLGACSASEQEMEMLAGDTTQCTPIGEILNFTSGQSLRKLEILDGDDDDTAVRKGIVTWVSDKVANTVKTASLVMYLKIALNLDFRFAVAMMILLSIILYASSVLLGLTQANGYNMLMFILKLTIIYNLTINYFYFNIYVIQTFESLVADMLMFTSFVFSDYAAFSAKGVCSWFGAVCDITGMLDSLFGISNILQGLGILGNVSTAMNKLMLFSDIDDQLSRFFDVRMWKLILALMSTGVTGVLWGVMLAALMVMYLLAIIVAVKTYLLAFIARYVLYGVGPLFLSFALFGRTRSLFDGWIQQLINFTLQPVFLFILLGMFHSILNGFIQNIYSSISNNTETYTATASCEPGSAGCQPIACNLDSSGLPIEYGCVPAPAPFAAGTYVRYEKSINDATVGEMCVGYSDTFRTADGGSLKWWRLCEQRDGTTYCTENSTAPVIPLDIWMIMAALVVCYLMLTMCSWVGAVSSQLAGGAVSLSDVKILGMDKVGQGIKTGIGQATGSLFGKGGGGGASRG